jgi:hypothetical protein
MQKVKLNVTVEGCLEDFLSINIDRRKDGRMNLTQPHLIDQILKDLHLPSIHLLNLVSASDRLTGGEHARCCPSD